MTDYVDRTFRNEVIILDGNSYDRCSFHDCTFQWLYVERFELAYTNWFYGRTRLSLGPETHDLVVNMFQLFNHEVLGPELEREIAEEVRKRGGSLPD